MRSPQKSIAKRNLRLAIPKTTIQNVLRKRLLMHPYKIQLKHEIKNSDHPKRVAFAAEILVNIDDDARYLERIVFTDEVMFNVRCS